MREIKFRAWDKEHDQMVENVGIQTGKNASNITISSEGIFVGNQCLSMILMQYTGIKDKNGKEMYEGDIVLTPINDCKAIVTWDVDGRFICYTIEGERRIVYVSMCDKHGVSALKVIGNIYENTELLK